MTQQFDFSQMKETNASDKLLDLTTQIITAYVTTNMVPQSDLPDLIASTHKTLRDAATGQKAVNAPSPKPAVPIKKSIFPDKLISLETGSAFKTLKKHLGSLGMTPEEYRRKWDLPHDYPMVCADYAARRSELAKDFKLGKRLN